MILAILIIVVFQVLVEFNRPHLPPLPDTNTEDEDMEGGTSNEDPEPSPGKSKICIAWEIRNRILGAEIMVCCFCQIDAGLILYENQYPESDVLSLGRNIFWSWIGIWGAVVLSFLAWTRNINKNGK